MSTCAVLDCEEAARARLIFVLRWDDQESRAPIELFTCGGHTRFLRVRDVLTNDGWRTISSHYEAMGMEAPSREKTSLEAEWL